MTGNKEHTYQVLSEVVYDAVWHLVPGTPAMFDASISATQLYSRW